MDCKIFIQIAAYRDSELIPTIKDCISKAKYPKNIRFGILYQDKSLKFNKRYENDSRFKIKKIHYSESKGACWAKHQTGLFYDNEEFALQIDSHTRFIENWDMEMVDMWKELNDDYAILTTYPSPYFPEKPESEWIHIPCVAHVYSFSDFLTESRPKEAPDPSRTTPYKAIHVSGGFIFGKGSYIKEVPYDPNLYFLGEETNMTVRLFTHGYNLYHPHKLLLWHFYTRANFKRHWDDQKNWGDLARISHDRIDCLLERSDEKCDLGIYGLGKKRTLEEFREYSGIDYKKKILHTNTVAAKEPPIVNSKDGWNQIKKYFNQKIFWDFDSISKSDDIIFWSFIFKDSNNREVYRSDLSHKSHKEILNGEFTNLKFSFEYYANDDITKVKKVLVWPYSEKSGWLDVKEFKLC